VIRKTGRLFVESAVICVNLLQILLSEANMEDAISVVLKFEQLINSRQAEAVCSLLTSDSVFIDSLGNRIEGAARIRPAWEGYFKMVPDYTISHSEIFANGDTIAAFGSAQGTLVKDGRLKKEDFWKTPAAWRAVVKGGKIALWQVFADNEPIRAIMRKYA
jgi:ketosteroid isomerase-like protein